MRLFRTCLLCALLAPLGGCLGSGDDRGPTLMIDLFWDARLGDERFSPGDCRDPDPNVDWMVWTLRDENGEEVASGDEDCTVGIDVLDIGPGDYTLHIEGFDAEANEDSWCVHCEGLEVRRFDVLYECDVQEDPLDECALPGDES